MVNDAQLEALLGRLEVLESRDRIRSVIERLPRSIDRNDIDEQLDAFWPDGRVETIMSQDTVTESLPIAYAEALPRIFAETQHHIGSIIIELKGEEAFTETYVIAHHLTHPTAESNDAVIGLENLPAGGETDVRELLMGFRYLDHFQRRDGVWKIFHRSLVADWTSTGVYTGIPSNGLIAVAGRFSSRSKDDPSYAHLAGR